MRMSSLPAGKDWRPQLPGWSLVRIEKGNGYWMEEQTRTELETGTVLLLAGHAPGHVLASQLNAMSLHTFTVMPARLTGLITSGEQDFLKQAASRKELAFQILTPANPLATKINTLCAKENGSGLTFRLAMLQLLVEAIGIEREVPTAIQETNDAKERLRTYLQETPADSLLEISFDELAQMIHCTPRHLSRIFYEMTGMSFRDKRAEIRLARARELLATSQSKVVEVAMESGYKSLSMFNLMFTRHFGISPGRWRQKNSSLAAIPKQRAVKFRQPAVNMKRRRILI